MLRQIYTPREVERLRRNMERMFENGLPRQDRPRQAPVPPVNLWTNEKEGVIITCELPGLEAGSVEISVTADTLTLSGQRQEDGAAPSDHYHRRERDHGAFSRTIQLPYSINGEKVEAVMDKGVLQITLPRAEAEKPRQIQVRSA